MKALILVGGLGTRLRPLTINTPKAMMPVLNKPFMAHVVGRLAEHGVTEVVFTRGHLASQMERFFGDGVDFGVKVTYVDESQPLGTAGGIKNCERHFNDGTFFVLNGDIFSTIDFSAMLRYHRQRGATATIALTPVDNPGDFGLAETESDGRISRFVEKPKADEITTNMINAGCYLLEPEVLDYIQPDTVTSIERETFQQLLTENRPFFGFDATGAYWIDMGNRDKYFQLNMDILNASMETGVILGAGVEIDTSARMEGHVIIGDNCRVGAGVVINGPTIIGPGCCIGADVTMSDSIIWAGVNIGARAVVRRSIIADNCSIGAGNRVNDSALADGIYSASDISFQDVSVWPGTIINN